MDKTITRKISQGMYIVTTNGGGCCVDAVSQVSSGDNPLITVAINKNNYTCELMKKNSKYAISVLGIDVNPELIKVYGFNSMRDYDKFGNSEVIQIDGLNIIKDSLGYFICEKVDMIENDTHILFIGKLVGADKFSDGEVMTYQYYQENKNELLKIKTIEGKSVWICTVCGYIYYGDEMPDDYECPVCGMDKTYFELKDKE